MVASEWTKLSKHKNERAPIIVDGTTLDIAAITAVGRHGVSGTLSSDPAVRDRIQKSVQSLAKHLAQGGTVYGVNTGFGGSADVRCEPDEMYTLQRSLLQHQHCGILPTSPGSCIHTSVTLKESWVRASMLIRANSLVRGPSAVRLEVIEALLTLLESNIIPLVPLRGSISASGDLSPLSYIAGVLEGNPEIYCYVGLPESRRLVPAPEALASVSLTPTVLGPKEGLGLINGTAISCAVSSLTLHPLHNLLSLSQLLTAMGVEAILGTATSFAPFISSVRPHAGQSEVSRTILSALKGSKLASGICRTNPSSHHGLFQDRYSIRTAPQWLGPFLEDLLLAHEQITTELKSTTDNPLIDPSTGLQYNGGNFQAVSLTTALEKSRLAAQAIGRLLFSQCTELLNPATNRGLPPSLCADEPSVSFALKGLDISMASYMSELSFMANPVHNHVVCAEMGNQALNSLALVGARYTETSVDLLGMMCAGYLYALCQALDLRAMGRRFEEKLRGVIGGVVGEIFKPIGDERREELRKRICEYVGHEMMTTTSMDTGERFAKIMDAAQTVILEYFKNNNPYGVDLISHLSTFKARASKLATNLYNENRTWYFSYGDASPLLGSASERLYNSVRRDLGVPMHRGVADHPTPPSNGEFGEGDERDVFGNPRRKTIGQWVSVIFDAIRDDRVMNVVVECLREM
ncbi:phenylalanine ammonia-lyase [Zopfia rhizophila CBS 207.26]|uniref:Phenylalanine ammonia-lyase n=1 Tax=Zopfia rhizophila CBS 207.26 TaxID=1314779 RepID=A0A6A6DEI9_9PEZI|nr:phenylalanine ammonia-lyase [Zopfia rhizophila CBS 207.26]